MNWTRVTDDYGLKCEFIPFDTPVSFGYDDEFAAGVMRWYNRYERSWVVSYCDSQFNQIGSSEYVYSKSDADHEAEYLLNNGHPGRYR